MSTAKRTRIYWRAGRAYADFRDYRDVGGGQEALKAPGTNRATSDRAMAEALMTARLAVLKRLRRDRVLLGEQTSGVTISQLAREHLILKAGKQSEHWLRSAELYLRRACEFFGANRQLTSIGVGDLHRWIAHLERMPSRKGGTQSDGTIRHHLNSLSSLYRRAQSLEHVPPGYNPVAGLMPGELPTGRREEADWLEVHEASWLLEVARQTSLGGTASADLYPLIATYLLTGGRKSEVLGLEVEDVSFERETVTFRPNRWRGLKSKKSRRTIRLWPQLADILRPHLLPMDRTPREGLVFPARHRGEGQRMITSFDKALDVVARRAGWQRGEVRAQRFRNTYIAARLQCLDHGAPISTYTVCREVGHAREDMVQEIYGHVGQVRHRSEVVEFRAAQHLDAIRDRFGPAVTRSLLQPPKVERHHVS